MANFLFKQDTENMETKKEDLYRLWKTRRRSYKMFVKTEYWIRCQIVFAEHNPS